MLVGAIYTPPIMAADEPAAVKDLIERVYSVYYKDRNKARYRELLTDDYLLLEHGRS